jgi:hypothetical protein
LTIADDLLDPLAQCALETGWKHKLSAEQMHRLAWHLHAETAAGRIKHDEHRKQVAAKWAKANRDTDR